MNFLIYAKNIYIMEKLLEQNNFTLEEIAAFMSEAVVIQCPKKTVLLREGEVSRHFYCATKGTFRAGFTDSGTTEHTRAFFSFDTIPFVMSYTSFVYQRPSLSFLDVLEDGEVLSWTYDYMNNLQETSLKWTQFLNKQTNMVFSLREIKEWQTYILSAEERYLAFLKQSPDLASRIPQHYIASYIGVTPEALSRIRKRISTKK
jgi:CRP-like cAMP-binding protein